MARLIFIVGSSGTGKSTSFRNLKPESTVIINTDKKDLPFEESRAMYSEEKKNYREIETYLELIDTLKYADTNPKINICILDTWNRSMIDYTFSNKFRAEVDGRKAWAKFGLEQYQLLHSIPVLYRADLNIYFICHVDTYKNDFGILMQRVAAPGNMVNDLVPESFSSVVLYTEVQAIPGQRPEYYFRTVNSGMDTCKSPMGMFKDIRISNDLVIVDQAIREYYK